MRPFVLLFLLCSTVYHSNLRPIAAGDSVPASLIPLSILLDHSVTLDRFGPHLSERFHHIARQSGGHWHSMYPIAGPVLVTPLYLPIVLVPGIGNLAAPTLISIARIAEKFVAVTLTAATAIVLLCLLRRMTSASAAWMLTLVFAFGTSAWSISSQALWPHTYGQLAIAGCLLAIERWSAADCSSRWYWIAGACATCALAIRVTNVALLPAIALVLWLQRAPVADYVRTFLVPALAGVGVAVYNLSLFNSLVVSQVSSLGNPLAGLLGLLFSPGRGLLVYTPVAVFALAAFAPHARLKRRRHWTIVVAASAFVLLHVSIVAAWPGWWGGYCFGPRLLTEILVPIMVLIAVGLPAVRRRGFRWALAGMAVWGCLAHAIGVYCYPKGSWDRLPRSVDKTHERLWDWRDNPLIRSARGGFVWEPYAIVAATVAGGLPAGAKKLQEFGIHPD